MVAKAIVVRKSLGQECLYGFESRPKHDIFPQVSSLQKTPLFS